MKIGTVTSKEFLTGAGVARLRQQKSTEQLRKKADAIRHRAHAQISKLADQRLQQLIPWWHEKFPTRELKIIFGNGTEYIRIDGRYYYLPWDVHGVQAQLNKKNKVNVLRVIPASLFAPIHVALLDVEDITNGHRDGAPADFTIEPIKKRGA